MTQSRENTFYCWLSSMIPLIMASLLSGIGNYAKGEELKQIKSETIPIIYTIADKNRDNTTNINELEILAKELKIDIKDNSIQNKSTLKNKIETCDTKAYLDYIKSKVYSIKKDNYLKR